MTKPTCGSGADSAAQSDDCYARIAFLGTASGEAEGTVGWREGIENRVVFQVWDGPSFAATGADLAAAFAMARAGIVRAGFTPLAPTDGGLDDLFAGEETEITGSPPRFQPLLWLMVAAILLALLIPALARAAVPEYGTRIPFPNAPYDYRYEGPNYDSRDGTHNSAARKRTEARDRGDPDWLNIPLDPIIVILQRDSRKVIARYHLEGGSFCDHDEDNCDTDGIFPIVVTSLKGEPVLGVVRHIGAHGQKLSILRPLRNRNTPVFEAVADYALDLRLHRDRLDVIIDRATSGGGASKEILHWPDAPTLSHVLSPAPSPDIVLPPAPPLSPSAAELNKRLRAIAATRDIDGFMALLADDVLVSFGGNGGKAEFATEWGLNTAQGLDIFWDALDRLLARGGWNEPGGKDDDGADYPQRLTYPWFFAAWSDDKDAENIFIADEGAGLSAAPDDGAPVVARLPGGGVLQGQVDEDDEALEWVGHGWLEVIAPGGEPGFVRQEEVVPLLDTRMIAVETEAGWRIEAMVAGD